MSQTLPTVMKAIRLHARGGPEQLVYEDAPLPTPGPSQALIRVHAASIVPTELGWDETYRNPDGSPRIPTIPGHDMSGIVAALGSGTIDVAVGDAVYALIDFPYNGSAAEFVVAPADQIAPKPQSLDHVHAAAVPLSALTAWQALFDYGNVTANSRVLIHGAAGGVGAWAVQLAHWKGAHVFATASARHADRLKDLGADEVIDYTTTRFEDAAKDVDVVLDTQGGDISERSWKTLRPGGVLVAISEPIAETPAKRADIKSVFFIVKPSREQLIEIGMLIDIGKLRPTVETVYPLSQAKAAFERSQSGHLSGKIVLRVVGNGFCR